MKFLFVAVAIVFSISVFAVNGADIDPVVEAMALDGLYREPQGEQTKNSIYWHISDEEAAALEIYRIKVIEDIRLQKTIYEFSIQGMYAFTSSYIHRLDIGKKNITPSGQKFFDASVGVIKDFGSGPTAAKWLEDLLKDANKLPVAKKQNLVPQLYVALAEVKKRPDEMPTTDGVLHKLSRMVFMEQVVHAMLVRQFELNGKYTNPEGECGPKLEFFEKIKRGKPRKS